MTVLRKYKMDNVPDFLMDFTRWQLKASLHRTPSFLRSMELNLSIMMELKWRGNPKLNMDRCCNSKIFLKFLKRDLIWYQFGKAEEQIGQLSGEEYFNFRTEGTDEGDIFDFLYSLQIRDLGIVYNNGKNAIKLGGLIPIYHFIDDKEAKKISKAFNQLFLNK